MTYKVKLKNAENHVLIDDEVYEFFTSDPYFVSIGFINELRMHSSGCCVFQKTWKRTDGSYKTETIYLHKYIAEKWLSKSKTVTNNLVGAKDGNKLDCRLENLCWRSRAIASRQRKTNSLLGYTGVYKENSRYRAMITIDKKSVHIGMYDTPEEAALAYNKRSKELYGDDGKVNRLRKTRT